MLVAGRFFLVRASCKRSAVAQTLVSWAETALGKGHLVLLTWFHFKKGKDMRRWGKCSRWSLHFSLSALFLTVECFSSRVFSSEKNRIMKALKLKT